MVRLVTAWLVLISVVAFGDSLYPPNPNPPVILVATINNTTPVVGEGLLYTVLEYRTSIAPNYATIESPTISTASVWAEANELPEYPSIEYRNKTRYYVYKRLAQKLVPQHSGQIIIPPAVSYAERAHVSNPVVLMVDSHPETRVTQSVSVGQFVLDAPSVADSVIENTPLSMSVVIHATGNFDLSSIHIGRSHVFRHYLDSKETQTLSNPWSQTHKLSYIFIPNRSGDFPLPTIKLWTLDPSTSRYQWLKSPKHYVTVHARDSPNAALIISKQASESLPYLWKKLQKSPRNTNYRIHWHAAIQQHPDRHLFPEPPRGLGRYEWLALILLSALLARVSYAYKRQRILWLFITIHVGTLASYFTLYPHPIILLDATRSAFYSDENSHTPLFMLHRDLPVYYEKSSGNRWKIQLGTGQSGWIQPSDTH